MGMGSVLTFDTGARLTHARPVTQSGSCRTRPGFPTQSRHLDSFASQRSRPLGPTRLIRRFPAASALAQRRSTFANASARQEASKTSPTLSLIALSLPAQSSALELDRICHLLKKGSCRPSLPLGKITPGNLLHSRLMVSDGSDHCRGQLPDSTRQDASLTSA
jgi:hypothetical protein